MNNCNFVGRMGANPKYYPGENGKKSILAFSLAIKKNYQVKQGESDCYWLNFKAFDAKADVINKYVNKGSLIAVSCAANVDAYKDSNGNDRTSTNFIVRDVTFCEKKSESNQASNNASNNASNYPAYVPDTDDEDLPF